MTYDYKDDVGAKRNLEKYTSLDPTLSSGYESKWLIELIECVKKADRESALQTAEKLRSRGGLDAFKEDIVVRIIDGLKSKSHEVGGEEFNPF